jgi:hypothetical protein
MMFSIQNKLRINSEFFDDVSGSFMFKQSLLFLKGNLVKGLLLLLAIRANSRSLLIRATL